MMSGRLEITLDSSSIHVNFLLAARRSLALHGVFAGFYMTQHLFGRAKLHIRGQLGFQIILAHRADNLFLDNPVL